MPTATAKAIEVEFFPLDTPVHFAEALKAFLDNGFRGTIAAFFDPVLGAPVWNLELVSGVTGTPIQASQGSVLIWDGTTLIVMTQDEFKAKYE